MPKIIYQEKTFNSGSMEIITNANKILDEYLELGFDLTLRQLYYQFVRRDWFPQSWADPRTGSTNNERSYKKLGCIINDARLAGLIDWSRIVDRTRNLKGLSHWESPADIVDSVSRQFRIDLWDHQKTRVEVWIEKDALIGVIEGVCQQYDVPYFSCRGYTSQSEMWGAAQRLGSYIESDQTPIIIHLGDHDPSGVDMSRDIIDRLQMFVEGDTGFGDRVEIKRIALNMDQVRTYNPPPNPAKITDSRAKEYIRKYGDDSWELDALDPTLLAQLIATTIDDVLDHDIFEEDKQTIADGRKELALVAGGWEKAVAAQSKKKKP